MVVEGGEWHGVALRGEAARAAHDLLGDCAIHRRSCDR